MSNEQSSHKATEKSVKLSKNSKSKWYQNMFFIGIIGIGLASVIVSIIYSSVRVYMGTDDMTSRVMIIPQVVFVAFSLLYAFYAVAQKILKN